MLTNWLPTRSKRWLEVVVLAAVLSLPGTSRAQSNCIGDCDGSGIVTVDELVRAVRIGLTADPVAQCPSVDVNGDLMVTVDEIVRAVLNAVDGCPRSPTPVATETPTPNAVCTPPPCANGEGQYYSCPTSCPGGCGTICAGERWTPTPTIAAPTFTPTQNFVCTPPPCKIDEGQFYSCGTPPCTGGCGTICAGVRWTPTPTAAGPTFTPTRTVTCAPTGTPYVGNCPECGTTGCFNCEMVREMCPAHPCGLCFNATPTPTPSETPTGSGLGT